MSHFEFRAGESLMDMRLEGSRDWSNARQMLHHAGVVGEPWLMRQRRRLEGQVSQVSVALTKTLERLGRVESFPLTG